MEAATGRVLAQRNAHQKRFPASTTKTMTALVALSQNSLDRVVRIGPNPPRVGESSVFLLEGEKFTIRDLVRAAMIKSANDSCVAIAEGVAGSVPAFAELMNRKAREVGARNTHFVNPHGLHDPNHYTTGS
jgi:D-alanyl-D-alanine carboxypeptidase (penicillin-binding protein 5/6)